ncbi:ABC transporter permease [Actinomadura keratinilytica]
MFAREFADGTVVGLFALPVSRAQTAAAKLAVYGGWLAALNTLLVAGLLVLGNLLGYGPPDAAAWSGIGRQFFLGLLTGLVALPVAWVATVSRSILGGVSTAIGLVIVAQVGVLAGAAGCPRRARPLDDGAHRARRPDRTRDDGPARGERRLLAGLRGADRAGLVTSPVAALKTRWRRVPRRDRGGGAPSAMRTPDRAASVAGVRGQGTVAADRTATLA